MALAALTLGKRTPQQTISDPGYYWFGNHKFRDDKEGGHGSVDMYKSIVQSCDTYYYILANDLGVDAMHDFMATLGLGQITGIDIHGELRGTLAVDRVEAQGLSAEGTAEVVRGRDDLARHRPGLQHVHDAAARAGHVDGAAGGRRFTPHIVKSIEHYESREPRRVIRNELPPLHWKPEHVAFIHQALYGVTQEGTSARSFAKAPYRTGGKTGTAQVIEIKANEKYNARQDRTSGRLRHALYTAFAPLEEAAHRAGRWIGRELPASAPAPAARSRGECSTCARRPVPSEEEDIADQAAAE
jgi:penicillin-binding protein 2